MVIMLCSGTIMRGGTLHVYSRFSYYMYTCVITMLMTCMYLQHVDDILWVQRHYMLYLLVSLHVLLVQRSAALLCNSARLYNSCCILAILARWSRSLLTGSALLWCGRCNNCTVCASITHWLYTIPLHSTMQYNSVHLHMRAGEYFAYTYLPVLS